MARGNEWAGRGMIGMLLADMQTSRCWMVGARSPTAAEAANILSQEERLEPCSVPCAGVKMRVNTGVHFSCISPEPPPVNLPSLAHKQKHGHTWGHDLYCKIVPAYNHSG